MQDNWPLQEAKNRLSRVVQRAVSQGPQLITVRGRPTAVVISAEECDRLSRPPTSLLEFFQQSPLYGLELDLERSNDIGRDVAV